jgi:hypothetical protein
MIKASMLPSGGASDSAFAISPSVAAAIGWPARAALTLAGLLARSRPHHLVSQPPGVDNDAHVILVHGSDLER